MTPKIQVTKRPVMSLRAKATILFLFDGEKAPRALAQSDLRQVAGVLERRQFKAAPGSTVVLETGSGRSLRTLVIAGLGKANEVDVECAHLAAAAAIRVAQGLKASTIAAELPLAGMEQAMVEGYLAGLYRFDRYLSDKQAKAFHPAKLVLATEAGAAAKRAAARAEIVADSMNVARDLVNEVPRELQPVSYVKEIRSLFRGSGVSVKVFDQKQLRSMRMHSLLQVGVGSVVPPRVVHLVYKPQRKRAKRVALVGKGVTFDAGGYNLKGTGNIETMKCDMAGSAAVVGAMLAVARLGLKVEVHGVVGLVENLVSGKAYKPGDVLHTRRGKTVEVNNTDAEGRLVLADLLDYASTVIKPSAMIDLATLTGACVVALGTMASAAMSNDDELRGELVEAAARAGEKLWPMPLYKEYKEQLKSSIADMKNTGSRWGGSITAGLFLQEFVGEGIPWVHMDIAGPAFAEKPHPFWGVGGTGAGVATLVEYLSAL